MGTYNKGILGPFSGKVGTVVGANWRGKDIMRSLPKKTNRTPTETQLLKRQLFTTVAGEHKVFRFKLNQLTTKNLTAKHAKKAQ
ncbi:DUF6266 family protein [Flavobacterium sp. UBA7682]|uniref:DUF6266 family protein n=1 Tax=Flavobacterium sp. UBA7682 TaxID=1946560 RepID=UPI0025C2068E|nr:DUF6266 family protein [Flavobacterium sp. UBA7682]